MTPSKKTSTRGKPTNLYLSDADLLHVDKLKLWLSGQLLKQGKARHYVSVSQTIRACVNIAKHGDDLLNEYLAIYNADGRRR